MRINTYLKPENVNEAYNLLTQQTGSQIIGGGAWLKILPKEIETAIDLSDCNLNYITETLKQIEIGSYCTLRELEKSPAVLTLCDSILTHSIGEVMGVPFRNIATIGGTVVGKFGFSDIITALLVLDAELIFFNRGLINLESYLLEKKSAPDLLISIRMDKLRGRGYYYTLKKTANDFSMMNIAISKGATGYRIAIGARPGVAILAKEAMKYLNTVEELNESSVEKAIALVLKEVTFGSNTRGSKEYRREVVKGLLSRGLKEVNQ